MCSSAYKVVREELDDSQIKTHFPQDKGEKTMVE